MGILRTCPGKMRSGSLISAGLARTLGPVLCAPLENFYEDPVQSTRIVIGLTPPRAPAIAEVCAQKAVRQVPQVTITAIRGGRRQRRP